MVDLPSCGDPRNSLGTRAAPGKGRASAGRRGRAASPPLRSGCLRPDRPRRPLYGFRPCLTRLLHWYRPLGGWPGWPEAARGEGGNVHTGRCGKQVLGGLLGLLMALAILPATAARGAQTEPREGWLMKKVTSMTLEQKVGQMFMTYAYGESVADPEPADVAANQRAYGVDDFDQLIRRYHLGGTIYFAWSDNVNDPQQINDLSNGIQHVALDSGAGVPALITTDQEQGVVTRIGPPATQFPGNMALGAARDPS